MLVKVFYLKFKGRSGRKGNKISFRLGVIRFGVFDFGTDEWRVGRVEVYFG